MGDKIRALREARGLSQNDLAEALGINQSTVSNWERGKIEPTLFNVRRLANILGVEPGELF